METVRASPHARAFRSVGWTSSGGRAADLYVSRVNAKTNDPNTLLDADGRFIGSLTTLLKAVSGEMTLGNRAIAYLDAYKAASEGGRLRGMTWSLHLSSLLSVKMVQGMRALPPTKLEARVLHFTALTGLSTFGRRAEYEVPSLAQAERDRLRNVTNKVETAARRADVNTQHVSGARSAGLSALFGISFAVLKGLQLKDKQDARTSMEMGGALMGGIANIMDYRIKAYELTIAKGQPGLNLFKAPKMVGMTDEMHAKTLKAMRVTSFKFLLPASMVAAVWAWRDAQVSRRRGDVLLAVSNVVGVAGSIFSLASSLMTLAGPLLGVSAKVWSLMAASLGLVGVFLVVGTFVAIAFLKEKDWILWVKDCSLKKQSSDSSKRLGPVHGDLDETLSKFFLAQAAI